MKSDILVVLDINRKKKKKWHTYLSEIFTKETDSLESILSLVEIIYQTDI